MYCGDVDKDGEMEGRICNGHYQLIFMSPEAACDGGTCFLVRYSKRGCVKKWYVLAVSCMGGGEAPSQFLGSNVCSWSGMAKSFHMAMQLHPKPKFLVAHS